MPLMYPVYSNMSVEQAIENANDIKAVLSYLTNTCPFPVLVWFGHADASRGGILVSGYVQNSKNTFRFIDKKGKITAGNSGVGLKSLAKRIRNGETVIDIGEK